MCCIMDPEVEHPAGYHKAYIVPILTYGWATTTYLCTRIYAFETRALRKILTTPYCHNISNAEVRAVSACSALSNLVMGIA